MVDIIKQDMTDIWAVAGDVVAPDSAKVRGGWGVEAVPRQWWNWFENRQDTNIAYMLQKGIPEWDAFTEYLTNKSYVQRNNTVYKCILTSTNQDPSTAPTYWVKAFPESSAYLEAIRPLAVANNSMAYIDGSGVAQNTTTTAFGRSVLNVADAAAARTLTNSQVAHSNLTALSAVAASANALPYFTGTTTAGTTTLTAFGRNLLSQNDALGARTLLALSDAATRPIQTSAIDRTVGSLLTVGAFGLGKWLDLRGNILTTGTPSDLYSTGTNFGFVDGGPAGLAIPGLVGISYGTVQVNGQISDVSGLAGMSRVFVGENGRMFSQTAASASAWGTWYESWTNRHFTVQTNTYDTTSSSVLKVGAFGLGGAAGHVGTFAAANDLNSILATGFYTFNTDTLNIPIASTQGYCTHINHSNPQYATQTAVLLGVAGNAKRIFVRIKEANVWYSWVEQYHTGNTGALTTQITNDVTASIQPTLNAKKDTASVGLTSPNSTLDPNTTTEPLILTNHANAPVFGPANGFWTIQTTFWGASISGATRKTQIAINTEAFAYTFVRSWNTALNGGAWTAWVRCDLGGNAASATQLQTARTINGVSFNGTSNITIPVVQSPGTVMEVGRYIDFHFADASRDFDTRVEVLNDSFGWGIVVVGGTGGYGVVRGGEFVANAWYRVNGSTGLYWENFGGGFNMTDSTWIRTYGGKNFYCDATIQANYFQGNGGGLTNVTAIPTQCTHNSGTTEFGYVILTGANASVVDLPSPFVMTGIRTAGVPGGHGGGYLRGVALRTY